METYVLINIVVLTLVLLLLRITTISKAQLITLALLLILTTVFDSMIVGFGIVAYDPSKILGIYIGNAPIEDFFYAVLAVFIVPSVWHILGRHHDSHT